MQFVSTRNKDNIVTFKQAVLDCVPQDGGLYVPLEMDDLRRWILYSNENTSFQNLAGSLTTALINEEFSPLICETIATKAFSFSPVLKQLDERLFVLELFHGQTGTYKDFGVSYLASVLETILTMEDQKSILLDATTGELGACIAAALRGKKNVKSVLLAPKGKFRGMEESDFAWNGGNIYPVEIDGTEEDCHKLISSIFNDEELVKKYNLSVANTTNIGRLLPQAFFYTYAFSRLKKIVSGDIYYSLALGNYGNLVSGLYGWKLSLPVNGFIVPVDSNVTLDESGFCSLLKTGNDEKKEKADPASPSNLERLEQIFDADSLMLKSFVFPSEVSEEMKKNACKELFDKYGYIADSDTSSAYAAALARSDITDEDEGTVVLIARNDPAQDAAFIIQNAGQSVSLLENTRKAYDAVKLDRDIVAPCDKESIISILNSLNLLRIF